MTQSSLSLRSSERRRATVMGDPVTSVEGLNYSVMDP